MKNKIFPYYKIFMSIITLTIIIVSIKFIKDYSQEKTQNDLPYFGTIMPFEFTNQSGQPFGAVQLKSKITVVDFIFTRCHGPCPIMAENMLELYELYKDYKNIHFVSITVDPDYDSVDVLLSYSKDRGVHDNRWNFLRSEKSELVALSEKSFKLSAEDLPGMHSTKFILLDTLLQIRGYYDGTDKASIENLKKDINYLNKTN